MLPLGLLEEVLLGHPRGLKVVHLMVGMGEGISNGPRGEPPKGFQPTGVCLCLDGAHLCCPQRLFAQEYGGCDMHDSRLWAAVDLLQTACEQ